MCFTSHRNCLHTFEANTKSMFRENNSKVKIYLTNGTFEFEPLPVSVLRQKRPMRNLIFLVHVFS